MCESGSCRYVNLAIEEAGRQHLAQQQEHQQEQQQVLPKAQPVQRSGTVCIACGSSACGGYENCRQKQEQQRQQQAQQQQQLGLMKKDVKAAVEGLRYLEHEAQEACGTSPQRLQPFFTKALAPRL